MLTFGRAPAELRAVVYSLRRADRDLVRQVNKFTRSELNPVWRDEVKSRATTALDKAVIGKGVRIKAGNPPAALAAQSGRPLSGGLVPVDEWYAVELGADRSKVSTYQRATPSGGTARVRRHTSRQLPARSRSGRVALPAMAEIGPRLASLWAATVVRTIYEHLGMN